MTRKQKRLLTRIIVAAVLFLCGNLIPLPEWAEMGVFLICYAVAGWDIVWKAITNILHGQVFDENFLMTSSTYLESQHLSGGGRTEGPKVT